MAFIQMQQSVVSHRKTLRLARLLNLDATPLSGGWWRCGPGVWTMRPMGVLALTSTL